MDLKLTFAISGIDEFGTENQMLTQIDLAGIITVRSERHGHSLRTAELQVYCRPSKCLLSSREREMMLLRVTVKNRGPVLNATRFVRCQGAYFFNKILVTNELPLMNCLAAYIMNFFRGVYVPGV